MKVVAFNGSSRRKGNTSQMINELFKPLTAHGIETELVELAGRKLSGCIACYKCFDNKDKHCAVTNDSLNDCVDKMIEADAIVLGSPTYFADVSAVMKALIERAGMVSRANGDMFKRKLGAGVVAVRRCGAYHVFSSLNAFFLIGQMIVVGSSYWNMALGREIGDIQKDEEGVKTMHDLGENIAWLLKAIEGK